MHIFPPTAACNAQLLGDAESEALFSGQRVLARLLAYEVALTRAMADARIITANDATAICERIADFAPDHERLTESSRQDGVVVPELIRQLRKHVGPDLASSVHLAVTSQDLIDTSTAQALSDHARIITARLDSLLSRFQSCDMMFGDAVIMGYTRMQKAQPINFSHRLGEWRETLHPIAALWPARIREMAILQFGGPVGDRSGFDGKLTTVAGSLARALKLHDPGRAWHTNRRVFVDYGTACASITGSCGTIGKDIALMARDGTLHLSGGGASSAMPHKSNPISAEILMTLATYSTALLPALHHASMAEQERSGSMWSLEWIVLPQLCILAAKSLSLAESLLKSIESITGD
ncbi:MAG: lyase family protein [Rhodobacteraceae bacterium]|nr:lyase family protein [Paracoccaceae bacterium]